MSIVGILIAIKGWFASLGLTDKIVGAFVSHLTDGLLRKIWCKFRPAPEEKAFKRAVKRWLSHFHLRGSYNKQRRIKTINDFCNHVITNHGAYDPEIESLYDFFEKELEKTDSGKLFLQELRTKALNKDQYENLMRAKKILDEMRAMHEMQEAIWKELNTHNKGKREFDPIEGYIQRRCSLRLKNDEIFKYLLKHKTFETYKLADVVSGKTECKGNKFILYSDAQTGKTTELLQLGWELQNEGRLIPIMFKIKGCPSIRQELPALHKDIEKGLVVIIDALDEKFDGDARYGLYNEIETYVEEHPHMKIVLTCRENFCGEHSFNGFTELTLNDLRWQDSVDYLKGERLSIIINEVEKRKLYEFVRTPFYLMALVDYYKKKKCLPENKGELYDFFIDRRLQQEEELGLKQDSEMTSTGKRLLGEMAVAMQLTGANGLKKDELLSLYDNRYDDYNRVLRTGLTESVDGGVGFTHNSFKEYFVSRYLFALGSLDEIHKLCCYHGTKIIRTGWNNTVALLLAQLPKDAELSKQILAWIVSDNKEMVLYVDRKLFDIQQRTAIFKDIIEWHKSKILRLTDYNSSKYEDLMNFGCSTESVDYLMDELRGCEEVNSHTVNILFLMRYLRIEDLTTTQAYELRTLLLQMFEKFKEDDEHIYVFFEVFRSPWLKTKENADAIYHILKDSEHPNIVNHLVEYFTDTDCTEKYADVIIEKGRYIHNVRKDGYTRIISRDNLYEAYLAFTTWESVKKALAQLKYEFVNHLLGTTDEDKYDEIVRKLLVKVEGFVGEYPEASDFVYDMLTDMAEDRRFRRMEKDVFIEFFDHIEMSQHYFDKSMETLSGYFIDNTITVNGYEELRVLEGKAYCAALLLNEERLEQVADSLDYKKPNGDSLLLCLSQFATEDMQKEIDIIRKNRYPKYWRDKNTPTKWEIMEQQEYNELMDYELFKEKVLSIVDEKAPKTKEDISKLRHVKVKFTDEEEERISRYVSSVFYEHYNMADDSFDLQKVREYVEDYKVYRKLVVLYTKEKLYSEHGRIKLTDEQAKLFKEATADWLTELANDSYNEELYMENPAITVLLHHDITVDDDLLLKLLPYSYCHIYISEDGFSGKNYYLFDYVSERLSNNQQKLLTALRTCMDQPVIHNETNWKKWCLYLIKQSVSSEYRRVINTMLSLPCSDPSLSIAQALLDNSETRSMVLNDDIMERCGAEKRLFIYEHLAPDATMDGYVKKGLESDFDEIDEGLKSRAVRLLLLKGSVKGLEYVENHVHVIDMRSDIRQYEISALPLLMAVYSKAIDNLHRSEYTGILNAVGGIACATDEGWTKVKELFAQLIQDDERKFIHLNWYLREWSVKRMEKASPVMTIEEVKRLTGEYGKEN